MIQQDESFEPRVLAITRGSTVDFPNADPYFHNVFSLSSGAAFDLGRYKRGDTRSRVFTRPGLVKVYCHVHSQMSASILVLDNDHFTRPQSDGAVRPGGHPGRHVSPERVAGTAGRDAGVHPRATGPDDARRIQPAAGFLVTGASSPPRLVVRTSFATLATVAVLLSAVFVVVTLDVRERVRAEVTDKLEVGQRMLSALEDRRGDDLAAQVAMLAENSTLKAALDIYQSEMATSKPASQHRDGRHGHARAREDLGARQAGHPGGDGRVRPDDRRGGPAEGGLARQRAFEPTKPQLALRLAPRRRVPAGERRRRAAGHRARQAAARHRARRAVRARELALSRAPRR